VYDYPDGSTRVSASWLMREAGFALGQDLSGGVRMSTRHYTLVADDGATTATFVQAAADVQQQVAAATGVRLAPEPDPVGTLDDYERLVAAAT
jgi:UDP-N-acetylmuramate dehydrogenase